MTSTTFRNVATAFAVALTLASAPAFAKSQLSPAARAAHAQAFEAVQDGISLDRAQALRECNGQVFSLKNYTWGNTQTDLYRSCMTQHGQPE